MNRHSHQPRSSANDDGGSLLRSCVFPKKMKMRAGQCGSKDLQPIKYPIQGTKIRSACLSPEKGTGLRIMVDENGHRQTCTPRRAKKYCKKNFRGHSLWNDKKYPATKNSRPRPTSPRARPPTPSKCPTIMSIWGSAGGVAPAFFFHLPPPPSKPFNPLRTFAAPSSLLAHCVLSGFSV